MAPMVATLADVVVVRDLVADGTGAIWGRRAIARARPPRASRGSWSRSRARSLARAPSSRGGSTSSAWARTTWSQYLLAADRTNRILRTCRTALHPAVLRAIRLVTSAAAAAGKPVAVAGELAGDPLAALVLVGLGVNGLLRRRGVTGRASIPARARHERRAAPARIPRARGARRGRSPGIGARGRRFGSRPDRRQAVRPASGAGPTRRYPSPYSVAMIASPAPPASSLWRRFRIVMRTR